MALLSFFRKNYWLFLLLLVGISYGQTLLFQPWHDDNALFFKLAHIREPAGFLGKGILGEGPYKYTAFFQYPLYLLFGHQAFPYFAFGFLMYFVAAFVVYKIFSEIFDEKAGKLAGFLYAAGYIASDGYMRLYNSVITSLSIILVGLFTLFYWRFHQKVEVKKWYFLAFIFFFLATEMARARTHYFIAIAILFELIFFAFKKFPKSFVKSLIRLVPFGYIFFSYFLQNPDDRTSQVSWFIGKLIKGEFHQIYGWVSSIGKVFVPDWLTNLLFEAEFLLIKATSFNLPLVIVTVIGVLVFLIYLVSGKTRRKLSLFFFAFASILWLIFANSFFKTPLLSADRNAMIIALMGGEVIITLVLTIILAERKYKPYLAFFILWIFVSVGAYSAYLPTSVYDTISRYLAHAFFALVGFFTVFYWSLRKSKAKAKNFVLGLFIFWGIGNLASSFYHQRLFYKNNILPANNFYSQLREYLPKVEKGDIFYFDVAEEAEGYFGAAFSVSQMPETTAIAWRYGLDRYDISMTKEFSRLLYFIENEDPPAGSLHTFYYSKDGLTQTSEKFQELLKGENFQYVFIKSKSEENYTLVTPSRPIEGYVPLALELELSASPLELKKENFPYVKDWTMVRNSIAEKRDLITKAFEYKQAKGRLQNTVDVLTSSNWGNSTAAELIDDNISTVWQADRILWGKEGSAWVALDLKTPQAVNRFVWINGYKSNTPIEYAIEVSYDGNDWQEVSQIFSLQRLTSDKIQIVEFEPVIARFVRMTVTKTLERDAPSVAEIWVVPSLFNDLELNKMEQFIANPFGYVPDLATYREILAKMGYQGKIRIYYRGDKKIGWVTSDDLLIDVAYTGEFSKYRVSVPSGGTKIEEIKLIVEEIPGTVEIKSLTYRHFGLTELLTDK